MMNTISLSASYSMLTFMLNAKRIKNGLPPLASSPLTYVYQTTSDTSVQIPNIWSTLSQLNAAAATLTSNSPRNAFKQKTLTSDNAAVSGHAANGASDAKYTVNVSQLAAAEEHTGTAFPANGTDLSDNLPTAATETFQIKMNSASAMSFYVKVNPGDTNQQVLERMVAVINGAGNNGAVKASVSTAVKDDALFKSLVVTAANTGTESGFTVTDISGNLATATNITSATTAAQDALYTVNGAAAASPGNSISLDQGKVNLALSAVTAEEATVTVAADPQKTTAKVAAFINQYNSTINTLAASGLPSSSQMSKRLCQSLSQDPASLSEIGISLHPDYTLALDQEQFAQALKNNPGRVEGLISGADGIASGIRNTAGNMTSLPPITLANSSSLQSPLQLALGQYYSQTQAANLFYNALGSTVNVYM